MRVYARVPGKLTFWYFLGTKRSFDDAYQEDDGEGPYQGDEGAAEKKAKLERQQVIRSEFEKRRGKLTKKEQEENEKEKKKEEEEALRSSKVKAAEFTAKKISGLEISQRESYLSLLETVIRNNYDKTSHGWNILLIFLELY